MYCIEWKQEKEATTSTGCNFDGPSVKQIKLPRSSNDCAKFCDDDFPNCTHFVSKNGNCILKKGKPRKNECFLENTGDSSTKCGILKKSCKNRC